MKRLFNDKSNYTEEAYAYGREMAILLKPLMERAVSESICLRDLSYVLHEEVSNAICHSQLEKCLKEHKESKKCLD